MPLSNLSLFKRSNGIWYISYVQDGRRRWKSTGAHLKPKAVQFLAQFEESDTQKQPKILFSQFVHEFSTLQAYQLRVSTLQRTYRPAFEAFQSACGDKNLLTYTIRDVEMFKRSILERASPTYTNILFRALRAAFNCAIRWGYLKDNPFRHSRQVEVPEQPPKAFTREEYTCFIQRVNIPVLRDLYQFAVLTGMRQGELLNLQWSDIDKAMGAALVKSNGRFLTKTGKMRAVPLNSEAMAIVSRRELVGGAQSLVFTQGGKALTQSYVQYRFKRYLRQAGLREDLRFHSLRHTFATWLVKDGVSVYHVQKLLGHSSIEVTQRYAQLAGEELKQAVTGLSLGEN